jgi:molecular chaperone GrpE
MTDGHDQSAVEQGGGGVAASSEPDAQAEEQLAQLEDRYKRAVADLDNYRKRVSRELEGRLAEGRDTQLRDWLEAVDSVERALRSEHDGVSCEGLRSVLTQMEAILSRYGVERSGAAGEPFDPRLHEAIEVRPSNDLPDHTIVDVARSGFVVGGRVLRPALVIVSRRVEPG